jgi:hypothetical protein
MRLLASSWMRSNRSDAAGVRPRSYDELSLRQGPLVSPHLQDDGQVDARLERENRLAFPQALSVETSPPEGEKLSSRSSAEPGISSQPARTQTARGIRGRPPVDASLVDLQFHRHASLLIQGSYVENWSDHPFSPSRGCSLPSACPSTSEAHLRRKILFVFARNPFGPPHDRGGAARYGGTFERNDACSGMNPSRRDAIRRLGWDECRGGC